MKKNFGITLPGEVYNTLCHSQPVLKKDKNLLVKKGDQSFKIAKKNVIEVFKQTKCDGVKLESNGKNFNII